jgi:MoaA/NifB/PqqE/SkfB family radical SAM enzyme
MAAPSSDTSCVVPWSMLVVQPDGCASFCCDVPLLLTVDGRPANLTQDSLDDLWNAPELVDTRAAMARGERPEACSVCWKLEAAGATSRRHVLNDMYARAGGALVVDSLPQVGAATNYRLERPPDWFILELGKTCNLSCRSCDPMFSSRVAADRVQSAWALEGHGDHNLGQDIERPGVSHVAGTAWFNDIDRMVEMIASGAGEQALLSLMGGEPFLIKQTWKLLEGLVDRGVAQNILVGITSNGQQRSARLAELAPHFRMMCVTLSVDGYGRLYEYLRHGGSWSRLCDTLDWLRTIPGVSVNISPTLQNTNALQMRSLVRWVDQEDLSLNFNALSWPARLAPANLPPAIRRRAAARLREYLATGASKRNVEVVRAYCEVLDAAGDGFDERLFEEFMEFTNDLDAARGENLAEAAPELAQMLGNEGVVWSDERRYSLR